jgi:hypothetical protein
MTAAAGGACVIRQVELIGVILVGGGLLAMAIGAGGWRRILRDRRIRWLVVLIGPVGTRILYTVTGFIVTLVGVLVLAGLVF